MSSAWSPGRPTSKARGAVTIRDLVKNSLRMRPDASSSEECRGGEALDMLQAMNTGHDGSLTTISRQLSPRMPLHGGADLFPQSPHRQVHPAIGQRVQTCKGIAGRVGVNGGQGAVMAVFMACSMSSASPPRHSPTTMRRAIRNEF